MIDYFYKSKKDPADLNDELLKKELSSGVSRILDFIRKQESDLLAPMFRLSDEVSNLLKLDVTLTNKILENQYNLGAISNEHKNKLIDQTKLLEQLVIGLSSKQQLKKEFRKILAHYISNREALGWHSSTPKKEELVQKVRFALDQLHAVKRNQDVCFFNVFVFSFLYIL
ncbi:hypothetical protein ACL9RF_08620 [Sphingobacterium sp. Mn56C]|uniref:hypothetical protein n=1 Tax=Sphingobacterium sp. Mn56C TaxID=3395261 RepID=UPI003BD7FCBA